jgi:hypothetical protein
VLELVLGPEAAAPLPRQCDGHSLLPFLHGGLASWPSAARGGWRAHACWEFDFRFGKGATKDEGSCGAVLRDSKYKYVHFGESAIWPPLLFDLNAGAGAELTNLAADAAHAAVALEYAQKMLSWRMKNAERMLTHLMVTDSGLVYQTPGMERFKRVRAPMPREFGWTSKL